ncbi:MAG: hypothetical protein HXY19_00895 [Thermoanaerobaculaceae bacterium]|nr:hypothetical protein [Thermoanaerobaculaceae bacterium]
MQNTIVKAFENDPAVVTVLYDEGGRNGETWEWLETVWSHYFLRGEVVYEATGEMSRSVFGQPATGLPFGRGFIVAPDGTLALPYFGHQPQLVIDTINALLGRPGGAATRPVRRRLSSSGP